MALRFYIDTAIFRDYYEDRKDSFKPLGEFAYRFLAYVKATNSSLVVSDFMLSEFIKYYSDEIISSLLDPFKHLIVNVNFTKSQYEEALEISKQKKIHVEDVLHAIIARDNNAIVITRDKHFYELIDIVQVNLPEDFI